MRIVAISDTHNMDLSKLDLPAGDVLVHAGDLTNFGKLGEVAIGLGRLSNLPYDRILLVPGNHDLMFERSPHLIDMSAYKKIELLIDTHCVIDGRVFYGSPWVNYCGPWAFTYDAGGDAMERVRAAIPEATEVLITHSPPYGILDDMYPDRKNRNRHLGCKLLKEHVFKRVKPKVHIFGHIHESYGHVKRKGVSFYNVAIGGPGFEYVKAAVIDI